MHPYTAAQTLRALADSGELFSPVWRHSLFIVLWFLSRRGSSLRGQPNIQATSSPGTAVITSKCVEAIERVLAMFERRWDRFQTLIRLVQQLALVTRIRKHLSKKGAFSDFVTGYEHKEQLLIKAIHATLSDIATDTGLYGPNNEPGLYKIWNENLETKRKAAAADTPDKFLKWLSDSFAEAVNRALPTGVSGEDLASDIGELREAHIKTVEEICKRVHKPSLEMVLDWPPSSVPPWVCSRNFWESTRAVMRRLPDDKELSGPYRDAMDRLQEALKTHWHRHVDALHAASHITAEVEKYYKYIIHDFKRVQTNDKNSLIPALEDAGKHITGLHLQLRTGTEAGVKWADVLMNRHLGYSNSGLTTLFDPNELAHAARVVCRHSGRTQFETIIAALRAVCAAQQQDGTWPCRQPFYWTDEGQGLPTPSVETALALAQSVNAIIGNPEGFGASREEVSAGLQPVYEALDRFFRWLSGNIQSIPVPPALIEKAAMNTRREPPLYGWSSDRVFEPGTIYSWATARSIEFLINYRQLLQELINQRLRSEFISYHPKELQPPLSDVAPTDLRKFRRDGSGTDGLTVTMQLLELLQPHKSLELSEGPWLPTRPNPSSISFYSALLYGPPGSSKTFLAKAIAAELRWPLISLSPADFLAYGDQHVEAQSEDIFRALSAGSRLVYFFDEIDELIRDRDQMVGEERSIFTFLTPSFLTKLQDLYDSAKRHEFIFILGTNYLDHIDPAAKRSGRIDQPLAIVYADEESRKHITMDRLINKIKDPDNPDDTEATIDALDKLTKAVSNRDSQLPEKCVSDFAEFGGFLSYPNFAKLLDELVAMIRLVLRKPGDSGRDIWTREINRQWDAINGKLQDINEKSPRAQFKPEIQLASYCDRPGALDELQQIIESIPNRPFRGASKSLRIRELKDLQKEMKNRKGDHGGLAGSKKLWDDFGKWVNKQISDSASQSASNT
jgi:hypothetical protein